VLVYGFCRFWIVAPAGVCTAIGDSSYIVFFVFSLGGSTVLGGGLRSLIASST